MSQSEEQGPLSAGDRFFKYAIKGLIGKGGQAFVYEAYDPFLDRNVALKIIPPVRAGRSLARRAQAEARVLARIDHEGIVKVHDAGASDDGFVYIVMERLAGRSLRQVLRELGRLRPPEMLHVAIRVAEAVVRAHRDGVIHRDLKPENVFVLSDNDVKVLDFGIAKVLGAGAPTTRKDRLPGTLLYMAPEQLRGFPVTFRSDVFALGTVLYESLYEHPALLGPEEPTLELLGWRQIEVIPPLLSDVDASIPRHVARFVQRAVMKQADQRYGSMAEFAQAARASLDRLAADGADVTLRKLAPSDDAEPPIRIPWALARANVSPPAVGAGSTARIPATGIGTPASSQKPAALQKAASRRGVEPAVGAKALGARPPTSPGLQHAARASQPGRSMLRNIVLAATAVGVCAGTVAGALLWGRATPSLAEAPEETLPVSRPPAPAALASARPAREKPPEPQRGPTRNPLARRDVPQASRTDRRRANRRPAERAAGRWRQSGAGVRAATQGDQPERSSARAEDPSVKAMEERLEWLRRDLRQNRASPGSSAKPAPSPAPADDFDVPFMLRD